MTKAPTTRKRRAAPPSGQAVLLSAPPPGRPVLLEVVTQSPPPPATIEITHGPERDLDVQLAEANAFYLLAKAVVGDLGREAQAMHDKGTMCKRESLDRLDDLVTQIKYAAQRWKAAGDERAASRRAKA